MTLSAVEGRLPWMALSDRERAILDFERSWWTESGPKELAIRKQILPDGLSHAALESCQRCQRLLLGLIKRYRDNEA